MSTKLQMIYLGADHRGLVLKKKVKTWLGRWGYRFQDLGAQKLDPDDDYPDFALPVARAVAKNKDARGILICSGGAGMDIVANKVNGIRSVLAVKPKQVYASRRDDHVNILVFAADYTPQSEARKSVRFFLETEGSNDPRFLRRLAKIKEIEE